MPFRARSVRTRIASLVMACVLPAFLVAASLAVLSHRREQAALEQVIAASAQSLTLVVERDFAAIEAGLMALSTSPSIDSNDLAALYIQAKQVLAQTWGINLLYIDLPGQQLVNTARPFGQPLPREKQSPLMIKVLETQKPSITDLFWGPVLKKNLVAMVVPVLRKGDVVSFLSMSLDAAHLTGVLAQQHLPPHWTATVLDAKGAVVTRTGGGELAVGTPGPPEIVRALDGGAGGVLQLASGRSGPVLAAYHRSAQLGWTVVVEVPEAVLDAQLTRSLLFNLLAASLVLLAGLALAHRIGRGISRPIRALIPPAVAIGRGEPVTIPRLGLKEADLVARALMTAGELLNRRERERDTARRDAATDGLTGLGNRRRFDTALATEIQRLRAEGGALSLILLDIDHFKPFNDSYGHVAGDDCLRRVAELLDGTVQRACDTVARYGGEEFAVILPETGLDAAGTVAERIRLGVRGLGIPHATSPAGGVVTVSLGVATVTVSEVTTPEVLVALADRQLYRAKAAGRDRVAAGGEETFAGAPGNSDGA